MVGEDRRAWVVRTPATSTRSLISTGRPASRPAGAVPRHDPPRMVARPLGAERRHGVDQRVDRRDPRQGGVDQLQRRDLARRADAATASRAGQSGERRPPLDPVQQPARRRLPEGQGRARHAGEGRGVLLARRSCRRPAGRRVPAVAVVDREAVDPVQAGVGRVPGEGHPWARPTRRSWPGCSRPGHKDAQDQRSPCACRPARCCRRRARSRQPCRRRQASRRAAGSADRRRSRRCRRPAACWCRC